MENNKRIILAVVISAAILLGFNFLAPKQAHHDVPAAEHNTSHEIVTSKDSVAQPARVAGEEKLESGQSDQIEHRLAIVGRDVRGSINLRGARLDDLVLTGYKETLAKDSPQVRLLEKAGAAKPSYVYVGWENDAGSAVKLPTLNTVWSTQSEQLTPEHPVTLSWDNGEGVEFLIHLKLDEHFLFTVQQEVKNHSQKAISLRPFQRVQRDYLPEETGSFTAYEGPISVMNGRLADKGYKSLREGVGEPGHISWSATGKGGWGGITDKYWLTSIGADPSSLVTAQYSYLPENRGIYQVTFKTRDALTIEPNASLGLGSYIFAGAKVPSLLQSYSKQLSLPDFDKAIDFGWFSVLTRPILYLLHWLYVHIGNFGLALMALTLIVKIVLYPLASKAAVSSARMRLLAPKITEIREKFKDDPMVMNQKVMALYREEKVNPAGGCLPILIQAPIFFCLYKMLNLSIDERHAPFFGWIRDLSVPDPTNLLNLFGLIPYDPTHIASFLHLSIWGAALGITFWILQRQSMVSMDPMQARIMQFMPLVYVFVMSSFPAGLLVYYTWNNVLTFIQQAIIGRKTKLPVPINKIKK
ncbi:membrane protein insertase YidC [Aristophania vespae]|uniref:Membrane protein insertase YidC n=1 Tax=Aristophania vespae TaxID=2697033 RepID=A0A6P1NAA3_9PROT|nr:membrane protein insertase YidC [Aristophania vespae]QHI95346.1 membrane protein insertase YidC [Aristophania vespae]